jgi:UPF0271 protein
MPIELNIDLGELADEPEELYALATVVNIACGGHAGDPTSMARALDLAAHAGARVAAHPSYADREGFGRRAKHESADEAARAVGAQCRALARFAVERGVPVRALKLHGALYHDAAGDQHLARRVLSAAFDALDGLAEVAGPAGLAGPCAELGLALALEGFADRRYRPDGTLVPRSEPDALLVAIEACAEQALALARSGRFATLCLHADTPGALPRARRVSEALRSAGLLARGPVR